MQVKSIAAPGQVRGPEVGGLTSGEAAALVARVEQIGQVLAGLSGRVDWLAEAFDAGQEPVEAARLAEARDLRAEVDGLILRVDTLFAGRQARVVKLASAPRVPLANRVRELRAAQPRPWTQARLVVAMEQAARELGEPLATRTSLKVQLSRWENGRVRISPAYRRILAHALGVSVEDLYSPAVAAPEPPAPGAAQSAALDGIATAHAADLAAARGVEVSLPGTVLPATGDLTRAVDAVTEPAAVRVSAGDRLPAGVADTDTGMDLADAFGL